ncbi:MAG: diguanylate cyclase [Candidatus Thiodiazotropha sp. 6PLUC2]
MSDFWANLNAAWRVPFIRYGLIVSVAAVLAFPILSSHYLQPKFSDLLISVVERNAKLSAGHMNSMLGLLEQPVSSRNVDHEFRHHISMLEKDYALWKAKLFDASGVTVYSTDSNDIGQKNIYTYFHEKVVAGVVYSNLVSKQAKTLEGQIVPRDVVEIYVPIMDGDEFLGAFELYYDITEDNQALIALIRYGTSLSHGLSLFIMILLLIIALRAGLDVRRRQQFQEQLAEEEMKLRTMTDSAQDAIISINHNGNVESWNPAAQRIFGYQEEDIIGQPIQDLIVTSKMNEVQVGGLSDYINNGKGQDVGAVIEQMGISRDGCEFPLEMSIASMQLQNHYHSVCVIRDITSRKQAEQQLRLSHQVMASATEGIIITDSHEQIVSVNNAFTEITGYTLEEVSGKYPRLLKSGKHPEDFYHKMWSEIQDKGSWRGEIWNRRKDGAVYVEWLSISAVYDQKGKLSHYVGIFSDMTQRKREEAELERLAFYDPLTGLANRLLLHDRLQQSCSYAKRNGSMVAVLFMDLDRFKAVNDSYGHEVGDQLLQEVSRRIQGVVREGDTVARLGGDEFVVVLRDLKDSDGVTLVAEKIVYAIDQPIHIQENHCAIEVSIGIALYPNHQEVDSLLKLADHAMYEAKRNSKTKICFADLGDISE